MMNEKSLCAFLESKNYGELAEYISGLVAYGFANIENYNPFDDWFYTDKIKADLKEYFEQQGRDSQKG